MRAESHSLTVNWLMDKRLIVVFISVFVLITILGLSIYGATNPPKSGLTIGFQTISRGYYSGHKSPAYYVMVNEDEWREVWNQHDSIHYPQDPLPEVNFSETIVIAVFMGEFNTGGYGIEIKEILNINQLIVVKVEKTFPGEGCILTEALSQPYHIVKINKIDKEITFETVERTIECP